eukprot:3315359-Amphidinium_carterae.1
MTVASYDCDPELRPWVFLWTGILNYLVCGGGRLLFEPLEVSPILTDLHRATLKRFESLAREWSHHEQEGLFTAFRDLENAPQTYASVQVSTTAFPVTLDAVLPTLPSPGVAAQVDILPLVSSQTREWLLNPSL